MGTPRSAVRQDPLRDGSIFSLGSASQTRAAPSCSSTPGLTRFATPNAVQPYSTGLAGQPLATGYLSPSSEAARRIRASFESLVRASPVPQAAVGGLPGTPDGIPHNCPADGSSAQQPTAGHRWTAMHPSGGHGAEHMTVLPDAPGLAGNGPPSSRMDGMPIGLEPAAPHAQDAPTLGARPGSRVQQPSMVTQNQHSSPRRSVDAEATAAGAPHQMVDVVPAAHSHSAATAGLQGGAAAAGGGPHQMGADNPAELSQSAATAGLRDAAEAAEGARMGQPNAVLELSAGTKLAPRARKNTGRSKGSKNKQPAASQKERSGQADIGSKSRPQGADHTARQQPEDAENLATALVLPQEHTGRRSSSRVRLPPLAYWANQRRAARPSANQPIDQGFLDRLRNPMAPNQPRKKASPISLKARGKCGILEPESVSPGVQGKPASPCGVSKKPIKARKRLQKLLPAEEPAIEASPAAAMGNQAAKGNDVCIGATVARNGPASGQRVGTSSQPTESKAGADSFPATVAGVLAHGGHPVAPRAALIISESSLETTVPLATSHVPNGHLPQQPALEMKASRAPAAAAAAAKARPPAGSAGGGQRQQPVGRERDEAAQCQTRQGDMQPRLYSSKQTSQGALPQGTAGSGRLCAGGSAALGSLPHKAPVGRRETGGPARSHSSPLPATPGARQLSGEEWTSEQNAALLEAYFSAVDPLDPTFWHTVARVVPGKTADQCKAQIWDKFTPPDQKRQPRTAAAKPSNAAVAKPAASLTTKTGRLKKPTKAAVKKAARSARLAASPSSFAKAMQRQQEVDRYIDKLAQRHKTARQAPKAGPPPGQTRGRMYGSGPVHIPDAFMMLSP
ncbi:hypothetical protein WJX84_003418 [Apatococcus fuscideae]|uniref:Myb-like domain-containing protein n=1 Tax=Apatococcus fuscideae TaxID=2026836 RepID=A0AAW1T7A7_9CHLO